MKHKHQLTLAPQQCQVLSAMVRTVSTTGLGYQDLHLFTHLSRPILYNICRRLVARKLARKVGKPQTDVRYVITAAGRKARERYAFELGVWPP